MATLKANGWAGKKAPVFVQSFEVANLKQLNTMIDAPIVQLINLGGKPYDFVVSGNPTTYADMATPAGLREIAAYADGAGPNKNYIVPRDGANQLLAPTAFVDDAHRAGLVVHPWTFRRENEFLAEQHRQGNSAHPLYRLAKGNIAEELELFYILGVDGVFTDNTDVGVAARERIFGK